MKRTATVALAFMLALAVSAAADTLTFSGPNLSGDPAAIATANAFLITPSTLDISIPDFVTDGPGTSTLTIDTHVSTGASILTSVDFSFDGYFGGDASVLVLASVLGQGSVLFGFPAGCCSGTIAFDAGLSEFDLNIQLTQDGGSGAGSFMNVQNVYITAETPEPATLSLVALGAAGLRLLKKKAA